LENRVVNESSHIFEDLEIDSLDFLDVVFDIDQTFQIKLPIEEWVAAAEGGDESVARYFVVGNLASYVDEQLAKRV
jgi:acyl carrier protein